MKLHWIAAIVAVLAIIAYLVLPKMLKKAPKPTLEAAKAELETASTVEDVLAVGRKYVNEAFYPELESLLRIKMSLIPSGLPSGLHPQAYAGESKFRSLQISQIKNPNATE